MELIITSKTYGVHVVIYDEQDHELISKFKWVIQKGKNGVFYARARVKMKMQHELGRRSVRMHGLIMKAAPNEKIDHIDHNGLNNSKSNLRIVNSSQSSANTRVHRDSSTGFKGVTYKKKKKLYLARIRINSKLIYGGSFKCPLDAARRYNELAIQYFGEYACLNEITEEMVQAYYEKKPPKRRLYKTNTTGFIGVSKSQSKKNPFAATILVNGKNKYLGCFPTEIDAAKAYNKAVVELGKPHYYLNIIP